MGPLQVVWFKRDLRCADHRPLLEASQRGPVLPLYVVEPEFWQQPDSSARQWEFCRESLLDLRSFLERLGQPLVVRCGKVEEVLERAHRQFGIAGLWSHEETGNGWTYARDLRLAAWARQHAIAWHEIPQFGVTRRLAQRQGWARRWEGRMAEPLAPTPSGLVPLAGLDPGPIPSAQDLQLEPDPCPGRQRGGRSQGLDVLQSFLAERSRRYQSELSSPSTAVLSCSRLSPHLSWGTLSLREVVQHSRERRAGLSDAPADRRWQRSLQRFDERLHWHCHFIQKLESQPSLEHRELHPLTAELRSSDPPRLAAWATGQTGLPFVDACMRSLLATGWLNFRMRAMLVSVASYQLWLAGERPAPGPVVCGLRTRHPLEPVPDAIGYHRHQHDPDLQPAQAGAGSRCPRPVHSPLVARTAPSAGGVSASALDHGSSNPGTGGLRTGSVLSAADRGLGRGGRQRPRADLGPTRARGICRPGRCHSATPRLQTLRHPTRQLAGEGNTAGSSRSAKPGSGLRRAGQSGSGRTAVVGHATSVEELLGAQAVVGGRQLR